MHVKAVLMSDKLKKKKVISGKQMKEKSWILWLSMKGKFTEICKRKITLRVHDTFRASRADESTDQAT